MTIDCSTSLFTDLPLTDQRVRFAHAGKESKPSIRANAPLSQQGIEETQASFLIQCNCAEIIAGANEEPDTNEWTAKSVPSMPIIFMVAAVSSTADDKLLFSYVY